MYPDRELFETAETELLSRASTITPGEAILLLNGFSQTVFGSEELYTLLDKIIGKNAAMLEASQVPLVLAGFARAPHKREKLFILFHRLVKKFQEEFTISQKCEILAIYSRIQTPHEFVFSLLEQDILGSFGIMSSEDFVNALIGYSNPALEKKFPILYDLIDTVDKRLETLDFGNCLTLLENFASIQKGPKKVIEKLL